MTYENLLADLTEKQVTLVAVSKTKPVQMISELYARGQRIFGENRVQEMVEKHEALPKDIQWHMIGHLQKNKVKYMASFVSMVHSVDNLSLLHTLEKQAAQHARSIDILLQIKIASEDSKSGWDYAALREDIKSIDAPHLRIRGVMGMATFTDEQSQVRTEFAALKSYHTELKAHFDPDCFDTISMGMSGDYHIAIEEGSTMVRIGSLLFGAR